MDRGTDGKESPKVTRREKEDPSTGMRNWTVSLSRWKRIGTGDSVCGCSGHLFRHGDWRSTLRRGMRFASSKVFLRSDLLPVSHHWRVWFGGRQGERERERTEKGTYLGEILVLWCLFIRAGGGLD